MKLPSFWGGVHPPQKKDLTKNLTIEKYLPTGDLVFPMGQHIGAPCQPVVKKGDAVLVGQKLGDTEAFVAAPILSSVSGTVKDVAPRMTTSGTFVTCVIVENDGQYQKDPSWTPLPNYETADPKEYTKIIREAGIVGFGGATFPTTVKLLPPADKKIDHIIINAVECEPYLNCDNRLMIEDPAKIIKGLKLIMRLFPEAKGVIGIENNKPEAIKTIEEEITKQNTTDITVQSLTVKYPQGSEKMLIEAITGREFKVTQLPADAGCIVLNVRTIHQIFEAIAEGNPVTTRIVTVTGEAITQPKNIETPLGTSVHELIDLCGGFKQEPAKILSGGPMMGMALRTIDIPVEKGTSGILALTEKETHCGEETACIRCGRCVDACPTGVQPNLLHKLVLARQYEEFETNGGMNCIECGSCTYVCPANKHLTQSCRDGKATIMAQRRKAASK
ncbi:MAG: electron transport complex subunit RsxC [Synergistaceae bacterium]